MTTARILDSARAVVLRRTPLWYSGGVPPEYARRASVGPSASGTATDDTRHGASRPECAHCTAIPPWVRAASGIMAWADDLYIVQDDVAAIVRVHRPSGAVAPIALPPVNGQRVFDDLRGNKAAKPDLESVCIVHDPSTQGPALLALGSGSTARREQAVWMPLPDGTPRGIALPRFYAMLRDRADFSGSELNLEGVLVRDKQLWLAQRGNGAPGHGRVPINAIAQLDLPAFHALLQAPDSAPVPALQAVNVWDLGFLRGAPLTFTDLALADTDVLFSAAAEDSPDTVRDGEVHGIVIGRLSDGHCALLVDTSGRPLCDKVEGLAYAGKHRLFAVVDADDPERPAELLEIDLQLP